jgi:Cu-processing system permease protein
MMTQLRAALVIGQTTLREALRNKVTVIPLAFALVLIAFSVTLASLSMREHARLIIDVGLTAASGLGGLIAVALTISSFARELERRTAYPVLVRPLPRWIFVLGKFLGLWATMVFVTTVMLIATAVTVRAYGDAVPSAFWASIWLTWLEMGLVTAVALLFSSFASPVLAALYCSAVLVAGHLSDDLVELASRLTNKGELGGSVLRVAYHVLPDLGLLSLRVQAANQLAVPGGFLLWATLYSATYGATALALAMLIFSRRRSV